MTEKLLQYIWQFQYFNRSNLTTTAGEVVEILFPGSLNANQGPDFLAARLKIGNTVLAGSVELHIKTSEWNQHGHQTDANYNNVILHVVLYNDMPGMNGLPVLELNNRISNLLLHKYEAMLTHEALFPVLLPLNRSTALPGWPGRSGSQLKDSRVKQKEF